MTYDKTLVKDLKTTKITKIRIGNGSNILAKGKGTVAITTNSCTKTISDVLYLPDVDRNLLSVDQLLEKGFRIYFEDSHCVIYDPFSQEKLRIKIRSKSFLFNPI